MKEYIYFNDKDEPAYSSSEPMEFEEQTLCIRLKFENESDRKLILDAIFGKPRAEGGEHGRAHIIPKMKWSIDYVKNGCEIWVTSDKESIFVGECYDDSPQGKRTRVMSMAKAIVGALNNLDKS